MKGDNTTGICYTWSGDKKIYEPDLFSAKLIIYSTEYCYRRDSAGSSTLVFGKVKGDFGEIGSAEVDTWSTYLPDCGVYMIHNTQDNGEDHYSFTGTYTKPENWSPPAGVDGPFESSSGLKYPYYHYIYGWSGTIYTWYNDNWSYLDFGEYENGVLGEFYGNKE